MTTNDNPAGIATADEQLLEQAAAWLTRLSESGGAPEQQAALYAWMQADPRHARAIDAISATWHAARALPDRPHRQQPAGGRAWGAAGPDRGRSWAMRLAAAAIAAVLGTAAWMDHTAPAVVYRTAPGERLDVALSDGSRVRLNAATGIAVSYHWYGRRVLLEQGDAEFLVAHDRMRPFTVATDRMRVRALGTDFAVRRVGDDASAVLVSGSVDLRLPDQDPVQAVLRPGQKATYRPGNDVPLIQTVIPADELAWRNGQIVFDRTSLKQALAEFQRYNVARIVVASAELEALQVSGIYKTSDLQAFLESSSRLLPVRWSRNADGAYVLTRR